MWKQGNKTFIVHCLTTNNDNFKFKSKNYFDSKFVKTITEDFSLDFYFLNLPKWMGAYFGWRCVKYPK